MQKKRIGIALLLIFLLWRSANSVYVLATDPESVGHWRAGLTGDITDRISRALDMPPAAELYAGRYQLLRDEVPPHSDVFFLHEYTGTFAIYEIFSYFRISALLYPCNIQMVKKPPAARVMRNEQLNSKARYVLDLRRTKSDLPVEFVKIGQSPGAVLWREESDGR
ncbi:MAG: hypothetical protein VX951_09860 [Planctomycetota bacterium]|nr:hypothetical protein [Planctomycetota bacterium]